MPDHTSMLEAASRECHLPDHSAFHASQKLAEDASRGDTTAIESRGKLRLMRERGEIDHLVSREGSIAHRHGHPGQQSRSRGPGAGPCEIGPERSDLISLRSDLVSQASKLSDHHLSKIEWCLIGR